MTIRLTNCVLNKKFQEVKEWCCKVFPFAEAWLTIIIPILLVIALNFIIFKLVRLSRALSLYHKLTLFLRKTEDLKKTNAEGTLEDASRDQICSRPGVDDREDEREIERNPCSVGCLMSVKGDGESCVSGRVERLPRGEPAQQVLSPGSS